MECNYFSIVIRVHTYAICSMKLFYFIYNIIMYVINIILNLIIDIDFSVLSIYVI